MLIIAVWLMQVPIIHGVDCVPSYVIAGGLVFVPLSIPFLEHAYGGLNWRKAAPVSILALLNEFQSFPEQQVAHPFLRSVLKAMA